MTKHALERIAERFPGLDPVATLDRIQAAFDPDSAWTRPVGTGRSISRVCIGPHILFPIRGADGSIVTVLASGLRSPDGPDGPVPLVAGLAKGVYQLPARDYHDDPAPVASLSSTIARKMLRQSPRHAWVAHPRLNPADPEQKDSAAFDVGRAAHRAVLGRGEAYVEIPADLLSDDGGVRKKEAKEFVADARAKGQTPLKPDVIAAVNTMAAAVRDRLDSMGITFDPAHSELTALAEVDGIWCRCMADHASADPREPIYDLKTTTDASPEAVTRAIMSYGYDVQAAHYRATWKAATGHDRPFRFVFVEKDAPHEVCVIELAGSAMEMANKQAARARYLWRRHLQLNTWPGYPAEVQRFELPEWYLAKTMEREAMQETLATDPTREALARAHQWQSPEGAHA